MAEFGHYELNRDYSPMKVPALKWPEIRQTQFLYTGELDGLQIDSLMVLFANNRPAASADLDMEGWVLVRYDPENGDVIGVEIEGFERFFLGKHHPDLTSGWAALKPKGNDGFHNSPWLTDAAALDYARRLMALAYQGTLAPGWPFEALESITSKTG